MTIWTPQVVPVQRWTPQESPEGKFVALDPNYSLGGQILVATNAQARYDLSKNIVGGRQPYTYSIDGSTFPDGSTLLEPNTGMFLVTLTGGISHDVTYTAIVRVRDANDQELTFVVYYGAIDNAAFQIVGPIPDAHFGVPFDWTPTIIGGVLPLVFRFQGLNLEALGFSFDVNTARIFGKYTGGAGSGANLFTLNGWSGLQVAPPDLSNPNAVLNGSWNLLNP